MVWKTFGWVLREVGHALQYLAFCHSEDAAGTVVARDQLPQRNGLLGRKSSVPPVVNEEREKLLRYGGLWTGVESVERLPLAGGVLPFTCCLNQSEDGQHAIEMVFSPRARAVGGNCEGRLPSAA